MTCDSRAVKLYAAVLLLVCACSGASPRTAPPSNQPTEVPAEAPPATAPEVTVTIVAADGLTAGTGSLDGTIATADEALITVYYQDATLEHGLEIVDGKRTELRVANWRFAERGEVIIIDK